ARRLGLHRDERGADHGGHGAGLGAARVVHVADRDLVIPARAVSGSRLPPVFALVAAGLALALVPAFKLPAFYESFLYLVFFWISLATSWNILSGYAGYFSYGHAAFFGAGVYTTATLPPAFAFVSVFAALAIYRSRWGMGLFAIRDDEDVAEVLGVPTYRYKLAAFALSWLPTS